MGRFRSRAVVGWTGGAAALATVVLAGFPITASAAEPPFDADLNEACNGAFTPAQLGEISKVISVAGVGALRTISFTITFPANTVRQGGRLLDCISINGGKEGLVESINAGPVLTSGMFSGSFTVGLAGSGADIIIKEGDIVQTIEVICACGEIIRLDCVY